MTKYSCYCTVGGPLCVNNTCSIPLDGFCYAYVKEVFDADSRSYEDEREWGCLPAGESGLMQCRGSMARHIDPKAMSCCSPNRTQSLEYKCNEDLFPQYVRRPDQIHTFDFSNWFATTVLASPIFMWVSVFLTLFLFFTFALIIIYMFCSMVCRSLQKFSLKSKISKTVDHDVDVEKNYIEGFLTDSSGESIKKEYLEDEITSGRGGLMLSQRTMPRDVKLFEFIGQGRFGTVRRALYKGDQVAIKIFSEFNEESFNKECFIYKTCLTPHDNILSYVTSDLNSTGSTLEYWLVTYYCPKKSLHDYLNHNFISIKQALELIYCIINGLYYLHSRLGAKPGIAHRDLKSKNILMKSDYIACIGDFGHSLVQSADDGVDQNRLDLQVGTKRYMAPEVLDGSISNNSKNFSAFTMSDIYQFSLVVWEILCRVKLSSIDPPPYVLPYNEWVSGDPSIDIMKKIVCSEKKRPPALNYWFNDQTLSSLINLMNECWRPLPSARLSGFYIKKKISEIKNNGNNNSPGTTANVSWEECSSSTTTTTNTANSFSDGGYIMS